MRRCKECMRSTNSRRSRSRLQDRTPSRSGTPASSRLMCEADTPSRCEGLLLVRLQHAAPQWARPNPTALALLAAGERAFSNAVSLPDQRTVITAAPGASSCEPKLTRVARRTVRPGTGEAGAQVRLSADARRDRRARDRALYPTARQSAVALCYTRTRL